MGKEEAKRCQPSREDGAPGCGAEPRVPCAQGGQQEAWFFPLTGKIAQSISPVTSRSMITSLYMEAQFRPFFPILFLQLILHSRGHDWDLSGSEIPWGDPGM